MELKSAADIFGYAFIVLAIITGAHAIFETLFHYSPFSAFLSLAPKAISSVSDAKPLSVWLEARTLNRQFHEMWDVALFYLVMLSTVLFMMSGCWLFLILKLLSIVNVPTGLLITWFIFNALLFFISASNQAALTFRIKDHRLRRIKTIVNRMHQNPTLTLKLVLKFFLSNWFLGPLNTFKVLLIDLLIVILYWPSWLIKFLLRKNIDLNTNKTRTTYFIACAASFALIGTSLSFFF